MEPTSPYHPGGNILLLTGRAARRGQSSGRDKWGHFCWHTMIVSRDEGGRPPRSIVDPNNRLDCLRPDVAIAASDYGDGFHGHEALILLFC